ncbi:bifunctional glutamate N-acetyltransferase/amino-acid acetyltransferase ArgJ [Dermacoccus nishinomiyaensis]|uniref:bifunctional glutamate N-acetyltransferase/amino-acid acetyltransferase ArgJ n=1 Tax=Dermacoccus TaxID=57495 RepID=UPI000E00A511|nr:MULTISPECIES: bifunctional glutamate N-acetyltransferase/amino-acid acetyltransferase ArgJ [Dermacoccus]MCT1604765.1 bifunctional glutamate N-acetyltransferase/amino-acid acetyltransferase ArgJ [Dermacoccus nishinomiyaensis]NHC32515.1 bifunctional glutamate N-acetyltransferase/amino-acid acetyltransferase ArgJ [Dermacoccus nishinomiyaensis]QQY23768.1 bifunctional glutamate N-acetyltransferase/amino-acid acetyltransferase ArgJ [Dermacoccus nishinomiyaensis]TCJ91898.1 glutamate N-acetyltransfe
MSVTAAAGFRAAGVTAGLKPSGRPDVALVVNDGPEHVVAAVFTSNRVEAAPVTWSRQVVTDGRADVVLLNSGGANACTGAQGFLDTHRSAELAAEAVGVSAGDVVVCSTGLIGELLPMDKIESGITAAAGSLSADGGEDAATAIMTTDTVAKECTGFGSGYTIGGMAKGAGMLAPSLATMLVVITTDAVLTAEQAGEALRAATAMSFDRIDSDGCQSTNDTVVLMASGASGVSPQMGEFTAILTQVCVDLAEQLIADAEGAAHDITIDVQGAANVDDALEVARSIARNNLFKCAVFGNDPNWGRVLAAVGTTSAAFEPTQLDVAINGVMVCRSGGVGDDRAGVDMSQREVKVEVFLHAGDADATVLTNDLTHDYVHENSAYST